MASSTFPSLPGRTTLSEKIRVSVMTSYLEHPCRSLKSCLAHLQAVATAGFVMSACRAGKSHFQRLALGSSIVRDPKHRRSSRQVACSPERAVSREKFSGVSTQIPWGRSAWPDPTRVSNSLPLVRRRLTVDSNTLWTVASKSVCGTASPIETALRYMSLCLSADAAWADITQAAFNRHGRSGPRFDRNPCAQPLPD